jgi:hypothetical protein
VFVFDSCFLERKREIVFLFSLNSIKGFKGGVWRGREIDLEIGQDWVNLKKSITR